MSTEPLPFSAACERNKDPILAELRRRLTEVTEGTTPTAPVKLLEVGSGTGQHAVHMTRHLGGLQWQPTELPGALDGLRRRIAAEGGRDPAPGSTLLSPLELDVTRSEQWPTGPFDLVFTANTVHIMPAAALPHLLSGVARVLRPGGMLLVYGPFRYGDHHTAPGNADFDAHLRGIDPRMGVRDARDLIAEASRRGLAAIDDVAMPAHNRLLILRRTVVQAAAR